MEISESISVLELFSGIGGMHAALEGTGKKLEYVGSYEINPVATKVYCNNFKEKFCEQNIMSLKIETLEYLKPDIVVMSPPCQPFTRQGLKMDVKDTRCYPFLHFVSLLDRSHVGPKMILLENVAGFESSEACTYFTTVLKRKKYAFQEFLLTPLQFGIPNSRLRYYLIAKKQPDVYTFPIAEQVHSTLPTCTCLHSHFESCELTEKCVTCSKPINVGISRLIKRELSKHFTNGIPEFECFPYTYPVSLDKLQISLSSFLEKNADVSEFFIKGKALKYAKVFDIVSPNSKGSCCFTKGYSTYVQGTGSVLQHNQNVSLDSVFENLHSFSTSDSNYKELVSRLHLRYFTPKEILKLMCFPESFSFPESCSNKQAYKLLGNSINVFVVTLLLMLLFELD